MKTRDSLGKKEAAFITKIGTAPVFSIEEARAALDHPPNDHTKQLLHRLEAKGWIKRIKRGLYALIPLSAGEDLLPQVHEYVLAMHVVSPAAIAYLTALNHHGMTEQIPTTVLVQTDHPVRYQPGELLGIPFKIISLRRQAFFAIHREWIDEQPFFITDPEKTIIDGLDLPRYIGGIGEIVAALSRSWQQLDERKLREYAHRIGNSAVIKRLGFLLENLGLGHPETLHEQYPLSAGYSPLDPMLPRRGRYDSRWRVLVNVEVA